MIKCLLKVKLNDYFPKIDSIPYNDYSFEIKYNSLYSKIKLSEKNKEFFENKIKIMNNDDLLLKLKLIDNLKSNQIIGSCDLLIPYIKMHQMFNNIFLSFHEKVQFKINPIKIKFFNKVMSISNIYLDLIFEITQIESNQTSMKKKFHTIQNIDNKVKIPFRNALKMDHSYLANNYKANNLRIKTNNSKSPSVSKDIEFNNYNRTYTQFNNKNLNDNHHLDINYNVINNNYLNYISTNNNNYYIHYDIRKPKLQVNSPESYIIKNNNNIDNGNLNLKNYGVKYLNNDDDSASLYYNKTKNKNQNLKKTFYNSENLNENMNTFKDIKRNSINNNKHSYNNSNINYSYNKKIFFDDINNKNSILYNKNILKNYINNRLAKKISFPPLFDNINNNKNKGIRNLIFYNNYNVSENLEGKSEKSYSRNSQKQKNMSISSVLNYFNYVKPFVPKSNKKSVLTRPKIKDKKILFDKSNTSKKNEINNIKINENYNRNDIKERIIKFLHDNILFTQKIKQKIKENKNLVKKYILCREKYYSELKKKNFLYRKKNHRQIKFIVHAKINSQLNEKFYLNMKKIKKEELSLLYNILQDNKINQTKKKIQEKIEHQKKVHSLLNLIRELIKNYGNLSQIYNDDEQKKILFKSLLLRYGIREKEEDKNKRLIEKFNELKQSINNEKNQILMNARKKEIENELYKNVINEEESEEGVSSKSGTKSNPNNIFKKFSLCSEDSIINEKEFLENKNKNVEEEENSIESSNYIASSDKKQNDFIKIEENNILTDNEEEEEY